MKMISALLHGAAFILAILLMSGCAGSAPPAEAAPEESEIVQEEAPPLKDAAVTFLDAYLLGKGSTEGLCTEDFREEERDDSLDPEGMIFQAIGATREDLSDMTYAEMQDLTEKLKNSSVITYRVESFTENVGVGTVLVTAEYNDYSFLMNDISGITSNVTDAYLNEKMGDLKEIYKSEGEDALEHALYNGITPLVLDELESRVKDVPVKESAMMLTFVKTDSMWLADWVVEAN